MKKAVLILLLGCLLGGFAGTVSGEEGRTQIRQAQEQLKADIATAQHFIRQMITYAMTEGGVNHENDISEAKRRIEALNIPGRLGQRTRKQAREHNARGLQYLQDGQLGEAVQAFQAAYQADPADVEIINNLGYAHLRQGDVYAAEQSLLRALVFAPGRSGAWANLGQTYAKQGNLRATVACFAHAYRFSSNQDTTRQFLQELAEDNDDEVRGAARQALRLQLVQAGTSPTESSKIPQRTEAQRTTVPAFKPNVPADARKAITGLLAAYNRGDGEGAYGWMHTEREKFRIANAYASAPVPLIHPIISAPSPDMLRVDYEMPHPGDIIAAVFQGGDNIESVRNHLRALLKTADLVKKTETWRLIRAQDGMRIDYGSKGVLRFADLLGTEVHSYATDIATRRLRDRPLSEGSLPFRVTSLIALYFLAFDMEKDSPERSRALEEIVRKIRGVVATSMMEITQPAYTFRVPSAWQDALQLVGKEAEGAVMYAGQTQEGRILIAGVKQEFDARADPKLGNRTAQELLWAAAMLDRLEGEGKVIEAGDSEVGGVPAKFFVRAVDSEGGSRKRMLRYIIVKDKVAYSLTFGSDDQDFDANYDLFMKIKDSFQFRRRY